jgi:5-(aminomethyl)-3-furanmethanol phosphate kinase
MTQTGPRVIKLGGSLLDWPELAPNFRRWLAAQSDAVNILIVGGGTIVEAVRRLDARHRFTSEAAHWLSIRGMSLTAQFVGGLLPEATSARGLDELQFSAGAGLQILEVEQFLRADKSSADAVPSGWQVTSDSIAARLATLLMARELVLLKSTLVGAPHTREGLAQSGLVDAYFAHASRALAVRIVNLRDPEAAPILLKADRAQGGVGTPTRSQADSVMFDHCSRPL